MKAVFLSLLFVMLMAVSSMAASPIVIQTDFADAVRKEINMGSTNILPDTTLEEMIQRAVLWTSVDIGGVEAQYRILTVAGTAFYAIADSIVQIVHATMRANDGATRTIKAWYPEYLTDLGAPDKLVETTTDPEAYPVAYQYWADSLQLMPAPVIDDDTVIIKCYVEHPILDTTMTSATGTDSLRFTHPAYTDAAVTYTCAKVLKMLGRLEESASYLADYDRQRQVLRQKYTRGFDIVRGTQ